MPGKKTHDSFCISLGEILLAGGVYTCIALPYCFLLGAGAITGIFLSPDLDVADKFRFGWWKVYWYPYSKVIPHRHWLSHMPVVGTIIRLFYMLPLLAPVFLFIPVNKMNWWWLIGLMISDICHWLLDITTTRIKRRFR
jgi:uncharacterized metal-binding protein